MKILCIINYNMFGFCKIFFHSSSFHLPPSPASSTAVSILSLAPINIPIKNFELAFNMLFSEQYGKLLCLFVLKLEALSKHMYMFELLLTWKYPFLSLLSYFKLFFRFAFQKQYPIYA